MKQPYVKINIHIVDLKQCEHIIGNSSQRIWTLEITSRRAKVKEEHNSSLKEKEKSNGLGKFMPKFNLGKHQEHKEHMKKILGLYTIKGINFKIYFKNLQGCIVA